jgi:hypothetical protein
VARGPIARADGRGVLRAARDRPRRPGCAAVRRRRACARGD